MVKRSISEVGDVPEGPGDVVEGNMSWVRPDWRSSEFRGRRWNRAPYYFRRMSDKEDMFAGRLHWPRKKPMYLIKRAARRKSRARALAWSKDPSNPNTHAYKMSHDPYYAEGVRKVQAKEAKKAIAAESRAIKKHNEELLDASIREQMKNMWADTTRGVWVSKSSHKDYPMTKEVRKYIRNKMYI